MELNLFISYSKKDIGYQLKESIYHSLYDTKDQIVLPNDKFKIQAYGKIVASFVITPQDVAGYP